MAAVLQSDMEPLKIFLKGESSLNGESTTSHHRYLSKMLTRYRIHQSSKVEIDPVLILEEIRLQGHKKVCQYQFKKNDIVWICKNCQSDETCVLCNECYQNSDHEGHDVYFYHSHAGGCCDCGDPGAWDADHFCHRHGKDDDNPVAQVPQEIKDAASEMFALLVDEITLHGKEYAAFCSTSPDNLLIDVGHPRNLVLHLDDIHSGQDFIAALGSFGIYESIAERSIAQAQLANDGFAILYSGIATDTLLTLRSTLIEKKFCVAVLSDSFIERCKAIQSVASWLYNIAKISDGLCRMICDCFTNAHLAELFAVDAYLPKLNALTLHNLFLMIMSDFDFKARLACCYADSYARIFENYINGIGAGDHSLSTLSVQFLNRGIYVHQMIESHDFLQSMSTIMKSIFMTPHGNVSHPIIRHRRYNPIIGDCKIIFTIPGMARWYLQTGFNDFLDVLSAYQFMHQQTCRSGNHVEYESDEWMYSFNLFISVSSLFDHMFSWFADTSSTNRNMIINHDPFTSIGGPAHGQEDTLPSPFVEIDQNPRKEEATNDLTLYASLPGLVTLPTAMDIIACTLQRAFRWQKELFDAHIPDIGFAAPFHGPFIPFIQAKEVSLDNHSQAFSFHLLLHRLYAKSVQDCCLYSRHCDDLLQHQLMLMSPAYQDDLTTFLDFPMQALALASQIREGKWARNGRNVQDQLFNYYEPPFCRMYRDLDIFTIQFCAKSLGAERVVHQLLYRCCPMLHGRFDLLSEIYINAADASTRSVEEFLGLYINLVSEVTLAPDQYRTDILNPSIRRGLIHTLASGPSTFSQLTESLSFLADYNKLPPEIVSDILDDIADVREAKGLDPPKYVLKRATWSEYDPCYPHISPQKHQQILENRPKITDNQPIARFSDLQGFKLHPAFQRLRLDFLMSPTILSIIRNFVLLFVSQKHKQNLKLMPSAGIEEGLNSSTYKIINLHVDTLSTNLSFAICSDTVFVRLLQLFTLCLQEVTATGSPGDIASLVDFVVRRDETILIDNSPADIKQLMLPMPSLISMFLDIIDIHPSSDDASSASSLSTSTSTSTASSLSSSSSDVNLRFWLGWVVNTLSSLDIGIQATMASRQDVAATKPEKAVRDIEARRKRARERALNQVKKSADAFSLHMKSSNEIDTDRKITSKRRDSKAEEAKQDIGKESPSLFGPSIPPEEKEELEVESKVPLCIICQSEDEVNDVAMSSSQGEEDMAYLCLSQSSRFFHHRMNSVHSASDAKCKSFRAYNRNCCSIDGDKEEHNNRKATSDVDDERQIRSSLHIDFCGHAMHYSCFDAFYATVLHRNQHQRYLVTDTEAGQFQCPLCKKLNNALVPTFPRLSPAAASMEKDSLSSKKEKDEEVVAAAAVGRGDAFEWISTSPRPNLLDLELLSSLSEPEEILESDSLVHVVELEAADSDNIVETEDQDDTAMLTTFESGIDLGAEDVLNLANSGTALETEAFQSTSLRAIARYLADRIRNLSQQIIGSDNESGNNTTTNNNINSPVLTVRGSLSEEETAGLSDLNAINAEMHAEDSRVDYANEVNRADEEIGTMPGFVYSDSDDGINDDFMDVDSPSKYFIHDHLDMENSFGRMSPLRAIHIEAVERYKRLGQNKYTSKKPALQRFLMDIAQPLNNSISERDVGVEWTENYPINSSLAKYLETGLAAVGFTFYANNFDLIDPLSHKSACLSSSSASATVSPNNKKSAETSGIDMAFGNTASRSTGTNNSMVCHLIHGLHASMVGYRVILLGHDALMNALAGRSRNTVPLPATHPLSLQKPTAGRIDSWFGIPTPFLAMPMLDALVLAQAIGLRGDASVGSGGGNLNDPTALGYVSQLISIGYLVQLIIAYYGSYYNNVVIANHCYSSEDFTCPFWTTVDEKLFSGNIIDSLNDLERDPDFATLASDITPFVVRLLALLGKTLNAIPKLARFKFMSNEEEIARNIHAVLSEDVLVHIIGKWISFMRTSHFLCDTLHPSLSGASSIMKSLKVPLSNELIQATAALQNIELSSLLSNDLASVVTAWLVDALVIPPRELSSPTLLNINNIVKVCRRSNCPYPTTKYPSFASLPDSYTNLHGCCVSGDFESPAVCLLCGLILDAGGKGKIKSHLQECGGDVGIAFLVQDCSILISHGGYAASLPSPYVDGFGERSRSFRGKPLHLEHRRLDVMSKMWTSHSIAREITFSRSSGNKVFIVGYY